MFLRITERIQSTKFPKDLNCTRHTCPRKPSNQVLARGQIAQGKASILRNRESTGLPPYSSLGGDRDGAWEEIWLTPPRDAISLFLPLRSRRERELGCLSVGCWCAVKLDRRRNSRRVFQNSLHLRQFYWFFICVIIIIIIIKKTKVRFSPLKKSK